MIHVTAHAIERFQERVAKVSEHEADTALRSLAIRTAADFGAPYVRLPAGQRVVIQGRSVVTVLPAGCPSWRLGVPKEPRQC